MADEADAAREPGKSRVEYQVYESAKRSHPDIAYKEITPLLIAGQGPEFIHRQNVQGAAVFRPVAVGGVVIRMVPRPDELRHARQHAEQEPERPVEPCRAEQDP